VSLIVAGTVRVPPASLDGLRPHMAAMMAASQAEDGCLDYNYAEDVTEPGPDPRVRTLARTGRARRPLQDRAHRQLARRVA